MRPARNLAALLVAATVAASACAVPAVPPRRVDRGETVTFRTMAWNVWLGGRGSGRFVGPRRVIDVINESRADVVLVQETYGSGELIRRGTGMHHLARGTNVSIFSRFPILEDVSVFEPFKCVGAILQLPNGSRVAAYSIWLPYAEDIWIPEIRREAGLERMLAACQPSADDLAKLLAEIDARLSGPEYEGIPIVIGGDFNSMSHLDYGEVSREHYGRVVDWPTSRLMATAGYRDAFREALPTVDRAADRTWSPQFPDQEQERIDFVYFRGRSLRAVSAERIDSASVPFPSDHAAVVAELRHDPRPQAAGPIRLRVAAYSLPRDDGSGGVRSPERAAKEIRALRADVVALHGVDDRTKRSGGINQAADLGRRLRLHASFAAAEEIDGGYRGVAVLSRFPVVGVRPVRLPDGDEPQVALFVEVRLPSDETVTVVNVPLASATDGVARSTLAGRLAEAVRSLTTPYIVLGGAPVRAITGPAAAHGPRPTRVARLDEAEAAPTQGTTDGNPLPFAGPGGRWRVRRPSAVASSRPSGPRPAVIDLVLAPANPRVDRPGAGQ